MVKISPHSKMLRRFGMHFSARGSKFGLYSIFFVKYGTFFTIARPFFDTRIFFMISFGTNIFKMNFSNFLVGSLLIGIGLVEGF